MPDTDYSALARTALLEITPEATIGDLAGTVDEGDGVVSVRFAAASPGYPGWFWTVSVAHVEGEEPTVLEAELLPGDGALLSPDWVPWSDRLAEYKAAQAALGLESELDEAEESDDAEGDADEADDESDDDDDDDESDDDDEDDDVADEDVFGSDVLHGGDLDGVDIDDLDADAESDDDDDEDESDDDDDESDESDDDEESDRSY